MRRSGAPLGIVRHQRLRVTAHLLDRIEAARRVG
jgi:hypothetical protein